MADVVYGVFGSERDARVAIERMENDVADGAGINAVLHHGHLHEEDVQIAGTRAVRGAVLGGLASGFVGALIGALIIVPMGGMSMGLSEYLLLAVASTIFGVVAGGVAGASECKDELCRLADDVESGKTLVTVAITNGLSGQAIDIMERSGAERAKYAA